MSARWTDLATWRGPTPNHGGPMKEQRGLVIHIAEGTYEGTISWQKNPAAQVSSHFVVDLDGQIAQVVEVDVTAWTQIEGNGHWLSVENAGHTPNALTPAQVEANAQLLARCHREFGVPLTIATSPDERGLGHHSMGAENGVNWGHSDCPGPAIKDQKPAILARAIEIVSGGDDVGTPEDNANEWSHGLDKNGKGWTGKAGVTAGTDIGVGMDTIRTMSAQVAGIVKSEAAIQATLDSLVAGGTSVDTAALAAQIKAVGDAESAAVAALQAEVADLRTRLVAAERAHADALAAS